ncbi:uncharacterized protein VTP21DRAFT_8302 [Calcarisporiella thermophila]|uniref:uncharacterized protein n=1 Tax=Calcarisporiella thermophila TaxID=911321 RepID=UPI00374235FE
MASIPSLPRSLLLPLLAFLLIYAHIPLVDVLQTADPAPVPSQWKRRLVAVGDIHGDYANAVKVLGILGVADPAGTEDVKWTGGKTVLVQTGDIVDRGIDTIKLYKMFDSLYKQARDAGGQVINLYGNHELMNFHGDWRYVLQKEIDTFGGVEARKKAWLPGGFIHNQLSPRYNATTIAHSTLFSHGDMHPMWASVGLDEVNKRVSASVMDPTDDQKYKDPVLHDKGPLWYRGHAQGKNEKEVCDNVKKTLEGFKVSRIVSGHTAQYETGRILSRCNGAYVLIDTGISSYYGGHLSGLEIVDYEEQDGKVHTYVYAVYPNSRELISKS